MWTLETEALELFLRATFIYFFLFVTFRLVSKKHFSELTAMDFILLLIISEAVSNSLNPEDRGIPAAVIVVLTLVVWDIGLNRLSFFSRKMEKFLEGTPKILILRGKMNRELMRKELISESDLFESMRIDGISDLSEIEVGVLETNGRMSFIKKEKGLKSPGPLIN